MDIHPLLLLDKIHRHVSVAISALNSIQIDSIETIPNTITHLDKYFDGLLLIQPIIDTNKYQDETFIFNIPNNTLNFDLEASIYNPHLALEEILDLEDVDALFEEAEDVSDYLPAYSFHRFLDCILQSLLKRDMRRVLKMCKRLLVLIHKFSFSVPNTDYNIPLSNYNWITFTSDCFKERNSEDYNGSNIPYGIFNHYESFIDEYLDGESKDTHSFSYDGASFCSTIKMDNSLKGDDLDGIYHSFKTNGTNGLYSLVCRLFLAIARCFLCQDNHLLLGRKFYSIFFSFISDSDSDLHHLSIEPYSFDEFDLAFSKKSFILNSLKRVDARNPYNNDSATKFTMLIKSYYNVIKPIVYGHYEFSLLKQVFSFASNYEIAKLIDNWNYLMDEIRCCIFLSRTELPCFSTHCEKQFDSIYNNIKVVGPVLWSQKGIEKNYNIVRQLNESWNFIESDGILFSTFSRIEICTNFFTFSTFDVKQEDSNLLNDDEYEYKFGIKKKKDASKKKCKKDKNMKNITKSIISSKSNDSQKITKDDMLSILLGYKHKNSYVLGILHDIMLILSLFDSEDNIWLEGLVEHSTSKVIKERNDLRKKLGIKCICKFELIREADVNLKLFTSNGHLYRCKYVDIL